MVTSSPISIRLCVLINLLSEHILSFMVPTYLPYMMENFIDPHTENISSEISYHSGMIEGLNRLMSFFACLFWGSVSDNIGRKYSILIVFVGNFISTLGFGLSNSFAIAVMWRMISGLFSGIVPITKAMLADLSDDSNIAILYSYFATGYGVASVVGPLIGGIFSHPYRTFPSLFGSPFFHEFPYFLPQLIQ
jgi:MFS family permease